MTSEEINNRLLGLSASVLMSKENDLSKVASEGLPLTVIDTIMKGAEGRIDFMAYVQLKAACFYEDYSFELALLKVGSEDEESNYFGVTLKRYEWDNIRKNIAGKQYDKDGNAFVLTADRFKDSLKFIHSFAVPIKNTGRYALAVLVNFDKETQVVLDAYYFEVI